MKEPDYYDRFEDSGGSSFLCTCDEPRPGSHREWCGAQHLPGNRLYRGKKPIEK